MESYSFVILDGETGNALGSYEDAQAAQDCLSAMIQDAPDQAANLAIVAFDKDGYAVQTFWPGEVRQPELA